MCIYILHGLRVKVFQFIAPVLDLRGVGRGEGAPGASDGPISAQVKTRRDIPQYWRVIRLEGRGLYSGAQSYGCAE